MKLYCILLFGLLLTIQAASALNLEVNVTQQAKTFDNQTSTLLLTVKNNEIGLTAEKVVFNYLIAGVNNSLPLGNLNPGDNITEQISPGALAAGSYSFDYYLTADFLGVQSSTQIQRLNVRVWPSQQITMKQFPVSIAHIGVDKDIALGKSFNVTLDVQTTVSDITVEAALENQKEKQHISAPGNNTLSLVLTPASSGQKLLTITAYSGDGTIQDLKFLEITVTNPEETRAITTVLSSPVQGQIQVNASGNLVDNFISNVGCFATGCSGDLEPLVISQVQYGESNGQLAFSLVADDTKTGNSSIKSCTLDQDGQELAMVLDGSGPRVTASITISTARVGTSVTFTCSDVQGNTASVTYAVRKKQAILAMINVSDNNGGPISGAQVYMDSSVVGYTSNTGIASVNALEGSHSLQIKARGFEDASSAIQLSANSSSFEFKMTSKVEAKFTPPPGFESYVSMSEFNGYIFNNGLGKWGRLQIHPQDVQIRTDTLAVMSVGNEIDAAKSLLGGDHSYRGVGKYIQEYDHSCLEQPAPVTCQAWHESDYKIIQSTKGVCADWATLTVSMANSMGIPARPLYLYGQYPPGDFAHAFTEVYMPTKGWTHFDTLWEAFDNPCGTYGLTCISSATTYEPDGTPIDRTNYYACGLPRCPGSRSSTTTQLPPPAAGVSALHKTTYSLALTENMANITVLNEYSKTEFNQLAGNQSASLPTYLYRSFNATPERIANVSIIANDNTDALGYNFLLTGNYSAGFQQDLSTSQYDDVRYALTTVTKPTALNPAPEYRNDSANQTSLLWEFVSPGVHQIRISFETKPVLVVYSSDPRLTAVGQFASRLSGVTAINVEQLSTIPRSTTFSATYLLGDYLDLPTAAEEKVREISQRPIRSYGDPQDVSLDFFNKMGRLSGRAVLASQLDAAAISAATKQDGDALILYNPDRTDALTSAFQAQKPEEILLLSSVPIPDSLVARLKQITTVQEVNVTSSTSIELQYANQTNSSASRPSSSNGNVEIVGVALLLLIMAAVFLWAKMRRRE